MKDFHFASLHEVIKPLTMRINEKSSTLLAVKIQSGNIKGTLAAIRSKWTATLPGRPFTYYFLDEFFDRQYRSEERFEKIFFNFTMLAVFIACLGLLGLASYSTVQRTKEIGIRKIMGASIHSIVGLLSRDFIKLVMLSVVIALPMAYFGMSKWLESFAYRAEIEWWIFASAALFSVSIAFATITFQSIKAALLNPIKSLKNE
jgi:putative ABC transport system permease protein